MNDIEIDARFTVMESVLASMIQFLIDKGLMEARFVSELARAVQSDQSGSWEGISPDQAKAVSDARKEAMQRFLIMLR